jgi:ADP-ribose pyrophosphatase
MPIQIGNIEKKTDSRWLNLFEVDYIGMTGKPGKWQFASRNPNPQPGPNPITSNAVIIVPLLKDGRKRKLVVIKEFRIPLGDYEYAVPAGLFDPGEELVKTVKRELKEETGLKGTKILVTSPAVVSSAGLSDEAVNYVFVECTGIPDNSGNEGTEDITIEVLDIEGVAKLRRSGAKMSSKLWPILLMFEAMGKIAIPRSIRDENRKALQRGRTEATADQSGGVSAEEPAVEGEGDQVPSHGAA